MSEQEDRTMSEQEQEMERALDLLDLVEAVLRVPWRDCDGEILDVDEYRAALEERLRPRANSDLQALAERGQR